MSKEAYVTIETAKLLKEHGFEWECNRYYYDGEYYFATISDNWNDDTGLVSIPTHQMALAWLREEHHIFIEIGTSVDLNGNYHFGYTILDNKCKFVGRGYRDFNFNYKDAVEAACIYVLENLI